MVRRVEPDSTDRDERLGEAIETYLELAEQGNAPDIEEFAARFPDLHEDLHAALEGLSLVRGLVGEPTGPGNRLESGYRIAGYRIVRELGRGGMGIVYEAVHVGLDRPVALKVLGAHAAPDSSGRRRFLNEAKTAAGLHHTHIVPVFDVGQVGGLCYYAMQRIEGSGLDRVLRHLRRDRNTGAGSSTGGLTPKWGSSAKRPPVMPGHPVLELDETASWASRSGLGSRLGSNSADRDDEPPPYDPPRGSAFYRWVADVGRQAADALEHAHHRGVIHRDVKPSNLLVDSRGSVWMADFGLARRLADPSVTQYDSLLGTPRYMSPEQAKVGPIDGRTDVYSLGATLYELLTLRPPFEGKSAAELVEQIRTRDPLSPRQIDARIPRDLETIVLKALAKRTIDRYATAQELADDLGRFLNHEPVKARRIGPIGRLWRVARRHPGVSAVSTVAVATVIAVVSVAYARVLQELHLKNTALGNQLVSEAELVRNSHITDRRTRGLELIARASALGPNFVQRNKLRDEAIELLVLRDVEVRPQLDTGRLRGIVFGAEGTRLAGVSEDSTRFTLWDTETRTKLVEHRLRAPGPWDIDTGPAAGNRNRPWRMPPGIALSQDRVVVALPDGQGLRIFAIHTGALIGDLKADGWQIRDVYADTEGERLVTIEYKLAEPGPSTGGRRTPGAEIRNRGQGPPAPQPVFEYRVSLWDARSPFKTGQPIATLDQFKSEASGMDVPLVAVAPEGRTIAMARMRGQTVSLRSCTDGKPIDAIETQGELSALALGLHNELAVSINGAVRIWDVEKRMQLSALNTNQGVARFIRFSPTGTLLAVAVSGSEIEIWDTASTALIAVLPTSGRVADAAFTPDGKTLAACGGSDLQATSFWAVINPMVRLQLSGFDSPAAAAFRDDGLLALTTPNMNTGKLSIHYWQPGRCLSASPSHADELEDGTAPSRPRADLGPPLNLCFFDVSGRLVTVEGQMLRIWSRPPGPSSVVKQLPLRRGVLGAARSIDGGTLVLARESSLDVWHSDRPDEFEHVKVPDPAPTLRERDRVYWRGLVVAPRGDRVYLADSGGAIHALALDHSRTSPQWVLSAPEIGQSVSARPPRFPPPMAISADGGTLAVSEAGSRVITLVDTERGTVTSRLRTASRAPEGQVWALAFAPGGGEIVVGTQQGTLEVWSPSDPEAPKVKLAGRHGFLFSVNFDPTGRYIAASGVDRLVDVWDFGRIRSELASLRLSW
jgi:serine/threonine protein kinase/WD40 repeat protein